MSFHHELVMCTSKPALKKAQGSCNWENRNKLATIRDFLSQTWQRESNSFENRRRDLINRSRISCKCLLRVKTYTYLLPLLRIDESSFSQRHPCGRTSVQVSGWLDQAHHHNVNHKMASAILWVKIVLEWIYKLLVDMKNGDWLNQSQFRWCCMNKVSISREGRK